MVRGMVKEAEIPEWSRTKSVEGGAAKAGGFNGAGGIANGIERRESRAPGEGPSDARNAKRAKLANGSHKGVQGSLLVGLMLRNVAEQCFVSCSHHFFQSYKAHVFKCLAANKNKSEH